MSRPFCTPSAMECRVVGFLPVQQEIQCNLRDPPKDSAGSELPAFHGSFETGDARAFDEDMRETSGRSLDSQCMAARGPSISYRVALEIRVRIHECVRGAPGNVSRPSTDRS